MENGLNTLGAAALSPIYDAAVETAYWEHALDATKLAIGGMTGALTLVEHSDKPYSIQSMCSTLNEFRRTGGYQYYIERLQHLESAEWDAISRQRVQEILLDSEISDPDALDLRADYVFLREKVGFRRRMGFRLNDNVAWYDAMILQFDASLQSIPRSTIGILQPILPHIAKSIEIGRMFTRLKERYRAALAALDHVTVGLAVARADGELLVTNSTADRILSSEDGLSTSRYRQLVCTDSGLSAAIRTFILEASNTARGQNDKAERFILVPRASHNHPLLVEVCPLNDSLSEIDKNAVGALIAIIEPSDVSSLDISRFSRMCQLTPAEAEVCEMMVNGLTGMAIAERRGTSTETVKSQMKTVLQKSGARRRFELIRMVVKTIPPISQPGPKS